MDKYKFGLEIETLIECRNPLFIPFCKAIRDGILSQDKTHSSPVHLTAPTWIQNTDWDTTQKALPCRDTRMLKHDHALQQYVMASMLEAECGCNNNTSSLRFDWFPRSEKHTYCMSNAIDPTHDWPSPKMARKWTIAVDYSVDDDDKMLYTSFASFLNGKAKPRKKLTGSLLSGFEIVSPILTFKDLDFTSKNTQLDEVSKVLTLNDTFVYWNSQMTSNHIHISHPRFREPASLFKLCLVFWYFEPVLMLMIAHWRRGSDWCSSMRDFLAGKVETGELTINATSRAAFSKYYERLFREANERTWASMLKEVGLKPDLPSVVHSFQNIWDRYASLNLLNLSPKGIGTIEVRLKQGSTDAFENKMWMHLILNLFNSAISQKIWISQSSAEFKQDAWDLYGHLEANPDFKRKTCLKLNNETRTCLANVLKEMKRYVPNKTVWEYWSKLLRKMHT
jgi:hypothetical protein